MFFSEVSQEGLFRKGCMLAQAVSRSDFRGLGNNRNLTKAYSSQINKPIVLIDQCGQIVLLIFHEAKNENLEGLYLALL